MRWGVPSAAEEIRDLTLRLRQDDDPFTAARLAELLHKQGRLVEARSLCEQAIARYPDYARIRAVRAQVALSEGDVERAEAELRMVLRSEPHNRVSRVALGRLLLERGAVAEARQHLEHALFLSPGDAAARELLARAHQPAVPEAPTSGPVGPRPVPASGSALDQALDLVAQTPGVMVVVVVDRSGLLIESRGGADMGLDAASAVAHETWNLAKTHMVRMRLGTLHLASVFGGQRTFVLAPCNPGVLAVAAEPSAKLGLVNRRVEAARNLLVNA